MTMNSPRGRLESDRYVIVHDGGDSDGLGNTNRVVVQVQQQQQGDNHNHSNQFPLQRVALLDNSIAPIQTMSTLPTTCAAPFDRTERKKAHTSAVYYSECFLHGIEPLMADTAAEEAQGKYDKWWIGSTASSRRRISKSKNDREHQHDGGEEVERTSNKRQSKNPSSEVIGGKRRIKSRTKVERTSSSHQENDIVEDETMSLASANQVSVSSSLYAQDEQTGAVEGHGSVDGDESMHDGPEAADGQSRHGGRDLPMHKISTLPTPTASYIEDAKMKMIEDLRSSGGSVETPQFLECLEILQTYYAQRNISDQRSSHDYVTELEGNWLTLSKPTYTEMKGKNEKGESLYSLGRISFDMFRPSGLLCSVQASFNNLQSIDPKNPGRPLHVPRKLMKDIWSGECTLQTYDIVVALTIEAGQDRKGTMVTDSSSTTDGCCDDQPYIVPRPIRGILTTQGYSIPDPNVSNRLSIWFSGGTLEVQDECTDGEEWKRIFDVDSAPDRNLREYASILAAKVLLGALVPEKVEPDGTMSFVLNRPIGGHGSAFVDVLFMDDTIRIMRGHHGSVYVCIRVPDPLLLGSEGSTESQDGSKPIFPDNMCDFF